MRKVSHTLSVICVFLLLSAAGVAAESFHDFQNVSSVAESAWRPAGGDWTLLNNVLVQRDPSELLARIDRPASHSGRYELSFTVRYVDGGFRSEQALADGHLHGGFGFHIGADNTPLGVQSWGNDESYLVWLNLDTRPETLRDYPQHYGLRFQVYESESNVDMDLVVNVDLASEFGLTVSDVEPWLGVDAPIRVVVDERAGMIYGYDPIDPSIRYPMPVSGELVSGEYISLRANRLSVAFSDIVLRDRD